MRSRKKALASDRIEPVLRDEAFIPRQTHSMTTMQTYSDSVRLEFDDSGGEGLPVVFIHGHPFNRSMWSPQVAFFRDRGWRVIAPDLRGYGMSPVTLGKVPLEVFARDVVALLDDLALGEVVLVGLSMGGQIVMELYHAYSGRIRAMVLADTFAPAETTEGKVRRNEMADRLVRDGMSSHAHEVLPSMISPRTIAEQPAVAANVLAMMRSTPATGAAAALRGRAERRDYVEMLGRIAIPTLVVVGREDVFTPVSDAQFLHERISGSHFAVIEGAGHMPNLERPAQFNGLVDRFLATLSSPAITSQSQ